MRYIDKNKLKTEDIVSVLYNLIGDINVHGETYADNEAFENTIKLLDLLECVLVDIIKIGTSNIGRQEASIYERIQLIGDWFKYFLIDWNDDIKELIEYISEKEVKNNEQ